MPGWILEGVRIDSGLPVFDRDIRQHFGETLNRFIGILFARATYLAVEESPQSALREEALALDLCKYSDETYELAITGLMAELLLRIGHHNAARQMLDRAWTLFEDEPKDSWIACKLDELEELWDGDSWKQ